MTMSVARWQLAQRQSLCLQSKVILSKQRIKAWHEHWDGDTYVAFSGGLDSTVLLHLVRTMYPDCPAIFVNTGMEFPEIIKFVRCTSDVVWLRPRYRFQEVLLRYGYPVVSKRISQYVKEVHRARSETATKHLRLTGYDRFGKYRPMSMISKKWRCLLDAPFLSSDECCRVMKKNPSKQAEKQYGPPMLGMRANESDQRKHTYLRQGCNAFMTKRPTSWPLAFWTHQDIWDYIEREQIPYSPIYDMGYQSTGCVFCAFGAHMEKEPNRFQLLKQTHPKLWKYGMEKLGLAEVLDYIGVAYQ